MCWRVTLGCGSLIIFLVTLFVVVVLVAGSFCIQISSGVGGWVCPLVPFYGLLLFPVLVFRVLSSSVITKSYLLRPVVLIFSTVACVVV